ncbi:hypothetical protein C8F04DRAFT_1237947 [Mycena alexandri]|uniref:Uncharacterized protein n=1 Tax=Mycena alexandri TaxID=1745969 RepID=A0AAD6SJ41_9AGAR|nr:hypothetical protein C8F04DRAFT_1237947 [Mycena alexandri]
MQQHIRTRAEGRRRQEEGGGQGGEGRGEQRDGNARPSTAAGGPKEHARGRSRARVREGGQERVGTRFAEALIRRTQDLATGARSTRLDSTARLRRRTRTRDSSCPYVGTRRARRLGESTQERARAVKGEERPSESAQGRGRRGDAVVQGCALAGAGLHCTSPAAVRQLGGGSTILFAQTEYAAVAVRAMCWQSGIPRRVEGKEDRGRVGGEVGQKAAIGRQRILEGRSEMAWPLPARRRDAYADPRARNLRTSSWSAGRIVRAGEAGAIAVLLVVCVWGGGPDQTRDAGGERGAQGSFHEG